jgi:prepilin-type N-terminal cleavage/methylation domain-containing protein
LSLAGEVARREGELPMSRSCPRRAAFTLIEILIVVVILGILAAIVITTVSSFRAEAERTAFATNGKAFVEQAKLYRLQEGLWLEDSSSGVLPTGFEEYITMSSWEGGTPVGGVWDAELNSFGIVSGLGVHFNGSGETRDDAFMLDIDAMVDDGDLATGGFRKIAGDRYYFVLAD